MCCSPRKVVFGIPPFVRYAETRNYPADKLLHMPDGLEDKQVAALLMKGMTAHYLLHRTYAVQPGDTIVVHAAAGGMGLILCQWAKALGATIVGTVSTHEKADANLGHAPSRCACEMSKWPTKLMFGPCDNFFFS